MMRRLFGNAAIKMPNIENFSLICQCGNLAEGKRVDSFLKNQ